MLRLPRALKSDGRVELVGPPPTKMRRFVMDRDVDVSGVSGTGVVAEGVVFTDGTAVLRWTVEYKSTAVYNSVGELISVHGHGGSTRLHWIDDAC
jgi:hypothetical protein